jgi:quercetin dioxygenase-like cupin family protein
MPSCSNQPHPRSPGADTSTTGPGRIAPLTGLAIVLTIIAVAVLAQPSTVSAGEGDATKKLVLQNDRIRAESNYYPAGAAVAEHEHTSPRAVVVVEGGTIEIRDANGKVSTLSLRNGDVVWRPPEKHSIVNVGSTPVRLIEVDILDCPKR